MPVRSMSIYAVRLAIVFGRALALALFANGGRLADQLSLLAWPAPRRARSRPHCVLKDIVGVEFLLDPREAVIRRAERPPDSVMSGRLQELQRLDLDYRRLGWDSRKEVVRLESLAR